MATVKVKDGYENKGKAGSHGKFKTKAEADAQRGAMFENGYQPEEPHHQVFKAKLHQAVSDAYDAHMREHGEDDKKD